MLKFKTKPLKRNIKKKKRKSESEDFICSDDDQSAIAEDKNEPRSKEVPENTHWASEAVRGTDPNENGSGSEVEFSEDSDVYEDEHTSAEENSDVGDEDDEVKHHKYALNKLKKTDPEFYKFLKDNDEKLLNFNVSDPESDGDQDGDDDKHHVPSDKLEKDSDESDFEVSFLLIVLENL